MTYRCNRCDWRGEDDEAEDHARETGHLRCIVCEKRSLTQFERQTCALCVGSVRADLADIAEGYALLEPRGLDSLTLLGDGTMQRHPHGYELDSFDSPKPIRDERPNDPLPVLAALASWEDYLRQDYKDPKGTVPANLTATIDYLTSNLDTRHAFAQTFPGFDDLATEIRHHRSSVQHAAALADDPVAAPADCFDCGGPLLRTYIAPAVSEDKRHNRARRAAETVLLATKRQRIAERSYGISPTPWPLRAARQQARTALVGHADEGLADTWTCSWCRRVYTQTDYFIGLRVASAAWVPVPLAAEVARRPIHTVRSWVKRLQVTAICRVADGAVFVWWPDVSDRAFRHADNAESQRSA